MDRRERFESEQEALIAALTGWQSQIWTALPGVIISFDPDKMTCSVQVAIRMKQTQTDGGQIDIAITPLLDCPVVFPNGGGYAMTFPLKPGDECLVVLSSRCIDGWWQSGGVQNQAEQRMHDLSDGFVIAGARSQPRVLPSIATDAVQLRSDDGETYVQIKDGSDVRVQADHIKAHARVDYSWDVFGYGSKVTYLGGNVWQIDNYTTPIPFVQTVNVNNHNISPPETP